MAVIRNSGFIFSEALHVCFEISEKYPFSDAADPTKVLSMGFGFVTFYQPEDAQQAVKEMQVRL